MIIIHDSGHQLHQPSFELYDGQPVVYPETSARADTILSALRANHVGDIQQPEPFPAEHTLAIHQSEYVEFLRQKSAQTPVGKQLYPSYFLSDTYAPITTGTFDAAVAAMNAALTGAEHLRQGERVVYSLCRPPGHHAAHHSMGGYCYFNNAAIAAQFLSQHGTVAVLDIDYHHGNGTQEAFYDRADVLYISLHADPASNYPYISGFADESGAGAGRGYNLNLPLPKATDTARYLTVLQIALERIRQFQPAFLVVSAGFDTYKNDPIGGMNLDEAAYTSIGQAIAALKLPALIIQEGGYDVASLGNLVVRFLKAFSPT